MTGFTYKKEEVESMASDIYHDCYMVLFDSDSDKGEEILVSILSQKLAINTVERIILANPHSNPLNTGSWSTMRFWNDVKDYLIHKILGSSGVFDEMKALLRKMYSECELQAEKDSCVLLVRDEIYKSMNSELANIPASFSFPMQESQNTKPRVYGIEVIIQEDLYIPYSIVSRKDYLHLIGYHE